MITYEDAVQLMENYIATLAAKLLFAIVEEFTIEKPYGWFFFTIR